MFRSTKCANDETPEGRKGGGVCNLQRPGRIYEIDEHVFTADLDRAVA